MIQLRLRTEFSFRYAFGRIPAVLDAVGPASACALTDRTTFGHVTFRKICATRNMKPIYGIELPVVLDASDRSKQPGAIMAFLARSTAGLAELYALASRAHDKQHFYYSPRLDYRDIHALSNQVIVLSGHQADVARLPFRPTVYLELNPSNAVWNREIVERYPKWQKVVCSNNLYPTPADRAVYEIVATDRLRESRTTPLHVLDEAALRRVIPIATDADFLNTEIIAADCTAELPHAAMADVPSTMSLLHQCEQGAIVRGLGTPDLEFDGLEWIDPTYEARLYREIDVITEKGFENYFRLVADMVQWAKTQMFVGPARGSAAGSLVSYLLGITDVDPLKHGLLFERFIDITRSDYPDIDIDFADDKRELVFDYLRRTYGESHVARLGNVLRALPKSAINDVVRGLNLPLHDFDALKETVEARFAGDDRVHDCIADALTTTDVGKATLAKYPAIQAAATIEGHAIAIGTHASGVVICRDPITAYCTVGKDGVAHVDKKDAETLGMVKVDVLGLSNCGVIGDCLAQIGQSREWMVNYPLDDAKAYRVFQDGRLTGIFQFDGGTQRKLTHEMGVETFTDIEALNALSRPGPLSSGTTKEYIARRLGKAPVVYLHPTLEPITRETYGCIIYQEQFMRVCREIGDMEWGEIGKLRKGISLKLGQDAFDAHFASFAKGATTRMSQADARLLWDRLITFGAYGFNKSHATAYAYIAYWCAVLKAYHPLEYAAALLKKSDEVQGANILRELVREGYTYVPVDPEKSGVTWSVVDGALLGGLTNIRGIAEKTAQDILQRRAEGRPLQPGHIAKLTKPTTPYDDLFQGERLYGALYENPAAYKIESGVPVHLADITEPGEYIILAKIVEIRLRDLNEPESLARRGGRLIPRNSRWLQVVVADDTGSRVLRVSWKHWSPFGESLSTIPVGTWLVWRCRWKDAQWTDMDILQAKHLPKDGLCTPPNAASTSRSKTPPTPSRTIAPSNT